MNGSFTAAAALARGIVEGAIAFPYIDILLLPTFIHLSQVRQLIDGSHVLLGAQNLYLGEAGAFTGEVSGKMLLEAGCRYVLVGHSERRTLFHETPNEVAHKFQAAQAAGLTPILCIGETQAQREQEQTESVIFEQLQAVIDLVGIDNMGRAVIAYEPVWAIGTGLTATPSQAQTVHAYIRQLISKIQVDIGQTIRILYGGSMKPDNAASLLAMPDIDGGLIGGASLDVKAFLAICEAADKISNSVHQTAV